METILKTRKLNRLLLQSGGRSIHFSELAELLKDLLEANVYVIGHNGGVLGYALAAPVVNSEWQNQMLAEKRLSEMLLDRINRITDTAANASFSIPVDSLPAELVELLDDQYAAIVPVIGRTERLGTLMFVRGGKTFQDDDLILAEAGAVVVAMEILRSRAEASEDEARSKAAAQVAVASLSYSELEAIEQIFEELDDKEGLLVASKIADRVGITRSVIVNALRKLESAGVIETRSLGMKGTYIKVLNPRLFDELKKAGV